MIERVSEATLSRFWGKVLIDFRDPAACWLWTGEINPDGYGRFHLERPESRRVPAHRFAYEAQNGPIPDGLVIDHLCRNRTCMNPAHMEPVTNAENLRRGYSPSAINKRKTECIHGHPFSEENTVMGRRGRRCRQCARDRYQRRAVLSREERP